LDHPRHGVIIGRLKAAKLLGRLLESFFMKRLEIEGERRFKDFLEEADEAVRPVLGVWDVGEGFFHLARRADADFIPVEKMLLENLKGPVCLLAGGALPANGIEELFEHRPWFRFARVVALLER